MTQGCPRRACCETAARGATQRSARRTTLRSRRACARVLLSGCGRVICVTIATSYDRGRLRGVAIAAGCDAGCSTDCRTASLIAVARPCPGKYHQPAARLCGCACACACVCERASACVRARYVRCAFRCDGGRSCRRMCTRSRSLLCARARLLPLQHGRTAVQPAARPRPFARADVPRAARAGRNAWHVSYVACPLAVRCKLCSATAIERAPCTTRAGERGAPCAAAVGASTHSAQRSAAWRRCIARPLPALCAARTLGDRLRVVGGCRPMA